MYVACMACRIKVLGYMEDLRSTYIFAEFLYLYQLTSSSISKYSTYFNNIRMECTIGDHPGRPVAYIASLGHYPLVLGIPWLKKHDINVNFAKIDTQFTLPNCLSHRTTVTPHPIEAIIMEPNNNISTISATLFRRIINNATNHYGKVEQFAL
jgi:hypothetical protein